MFHGIINIYKEPGYTSNDVVAKLRGILRQRKIGHTGTLDPAAEGVLPVCLGKGTRLAEYLTDKEKVYEAVLLLGVVTDTQDTTGTVLSRRGTEGITENMFRDAAASFEGSYDQVPPMYSAIKIDGKRLYELARKGIEVERKARPVRIISLEIKEFDNPRAVIRVRCSRGTYIRTLCHDIGERLKCGAAMEHLLREEAGPFTIKTALTLSRVEEAFRDGTIGEHIIPVDRIFAGLPAVTAAGETADKFVRNGNPIPREIFEREMTARIQAEDGCAEEFRTMPEAGGQVRVYLADQTFAGIYEYQDEPGKHRWKAARLFLGGE